MKIKVSAILLFFLLILNHKNAVSQQIIGITESDQLFKMADATNPASITTPVTVTGITAGQTIEGIDYRPSTGELYALGYNSGNGDAQLYILNPATATATVINATPVTLNLGPGSIGFDFNPVVDRIRVVSALGTNYRLNPNDGSVAAIDINLAYNSIDVNGNQTPSIGSCAYSNSYIGSEATVLYDYDENVNVLAVQNPPNNGTLSTLGNSFIFVNSADPSSDMDIYFNPATHSNIAYMSANTSGTNDDLYIINLSAGVATLVGAIGTGLPVKDIAVVIDNTVPPLIGNVIYGLTKNTNNLISFDSDNSSIIRSLVPVTGITVDQTLVAIDFRPLDLNLYGLGYNANNGDYQLYRIDQSTGVASAINSTPGTLALGTGPISFDFNPTVDRIRVMSGNDANYRLNPIDGSIAATDVNMNYVTGDPNAGRNPFIGTGAYTNSYRGAISSTLFAIDDSIGAWTGINPPNNGSINTITTLTIPFTLTDPTDNIDFFYDSLLQVNTGYLCANTNNSTYDSIYKITTSGSLTTLGSVGFGISVRDIAAKLLFKNGTTGIETVNADKNKFSAYPNPVKDITHLIFPSEINKQTTLVVADLTGRIVYSENLNEGIQEMNLSLANLNAGIYTVSLKSGNTIDAVLKLIRQ